MMRVVCLMLQVLSFCLGAILTLVCGRIRTQTCWILVCYGPSIEHLLSAIPEYVSVHVVQRPSQSSSIYLDFLNLIYK